MSGEIVVDISKIGYNVLITDNKNKIFSSQLATHSIFNIVTLNKAIGLTTISFQHGLGYIPKTWAFLLQGTAPNDYLSRIPIIKTSAPGDVDYYINGNLIVIVTSSTAAMVFKVVIFTRSPNP